MAESNEKVVNIEVVGEKPIKRTTKTAATSKTTAKTTAKSSEGKAPAKKAATPKKAAAQTAEAVNETAVAAEEVVKEAPVKAETPAKKTAKKAAAKAPLYINGRYVVEKSLPVKPAKGAKPYAEAKGKVKVTLVKSTAGCLKDQQATVKALGLTKIRSSNVLPDNAAIRGMVFKVKHLVVIEEVK